MFDAPRVMGTLCVVFIGGYILTSSIGGFAGAVGIGIALYYTSGFVNSLDRRQRRERGPSRHRNRRR